MSRKITIEHHEPVSFLSDPSEQPKSGEMYSQDFRLRLPEGNPDRAAAEAEFDRRRKNAAKEFDELGPTLIAALAKAETLED